MQKEVEREGELKKRMKENIFQKENVVPEFFEDYHKEYIGKILDEVKKDLYNTENELTEEWFAERDSEFRSKIMAKIQKWFGE